MELEGSWQFLAIDGAEVRLRSGGSGLMSVDVKAPVRSGTLQVVGAIATVHLVLALDKIKTGNFLTEAAARSFISGYRAHDLVYFGQGPRDGRAFNVSGRATAGSLDLEISLVISAIAASPKPEVELVGSANFGQVHIPLPGMGTVDNMSVDIDAKLAISRS